jgi:hypothetical protein
MYTNCQAVLAFSLFILLEANVLLHNQMKFPHHRTQRLDYRFFDDVEENISLKKAQ